VASCNAQTTRNGSLVERSCNGHAAAAYNGHPTVTPRCRAALKQRSNNGHSTYRGQARLARDRAAAAGARSVQVAVAAPAGKRRAAAPDDGSLDACRGDSVRESVTVRRRALSGSYYESCIRTRRLARAHDNESVGTCRDDSARDSGAATIAATRLRAPTGALQRATAARQRATSAVTAAAPPPPWRSGRSVVIQRSDNGRRRIGRGSSQCRSRTGATTRNTE
jgi:hypothetical protein